MVLHGSWHKRAEVIGPESDIYLLGVEEYAEKALKELREAYKRAREDTRSIDDAGLMHAIQILENLKAE